MQPIVYRRLLQWATAFEFLRAAGKWLPSLLLALLNLFREGLFSKPGQGETRRPVDDVLHTVYELDWHVYGETLLGDPAGTLFSRSLLLCGGTRVCGGTLWFTMGYHCI